MYEEKREVFAPASSEPEAAAIVCDGRQWEYLAADDKVYGPYASGQITQWRSAGFFTGASAVPMRAYTAPKAPQVAADDFLADMDEDDEPAPPPVEAKWTNSDKIDFAPTTRA